MGSVGAAKNSYTYSDYAKAVALWSTDMESVTTKDRNILESFIAEEVKNVGPVTNSYGISRGISMSDEELNLLKVGETFSEGKLASWSSKVGIAQSFAKNNVTPNKPNKVIIRTKEPVYTAAKIGRILPKKQYAESESLMSASAKFKIVKMKVDKKNYTEIWVTPIIEK